MFFVGFVVGCFGGFSVFCWTFCWCLKPKHNQKDPIYVVFVLMFFVECRVCLCFFMLLGSLVTTGLFVVFFWCSLEGSKMFWECFAIFSVVLSSPFKRV